MKSFAITSFIASLLAVSSVAQAVPISPAVDSLAGRYLTGHLVTPINGTKIEKTMAVQYSTLKGLVHTETTLDLYLTKWPVADSGAFIKNGVKIATGVTGPNSASDIDAAFATTGFCGRYYLTVVENQISVSGVISKLVDTPLLMLEC